MQHEQRFDEKGIAYSNTRLYYVWQSMKSRCNTPSHTSYKHYGGRGITVCKEWAEDFAAFREWAMETGYDEDAPRGEYTLERKDVDGPYSPENCCWKTIQDQERNKRTTVYVEAHGECVPLVDRYTRSEADKIRKTIKRRAQGVRPMEEYNRERAEKWAEKLEQFKVVLRQNPGASERKLAEITGMSKSTIRRLKKKAELWHN